MPRRAPTIVVLLLSVGAILVAALLARADPTVLAFVLGPLDPVLVTALACGLGLAGLRLGLDLGWIPGLGGSRGAYLGAIALGVALTVPAVVLDLFGGFPRDLNLPAPQAYLAYPAIALVAQFAFHTAPIGLVALAARRFLDDPSRARRPALVLAVLPEPFLQVAWGLRHSPLWTNLVVGPHLLLFNLVEVIVLTRHGFLAAYLFRLGYYAVWHVAWGQVRLGILFGA